MIHRQGMVFFDIQDITKLMYRPRSAYDLEEKERASPSILDIIPDDVKWTFEHYSSNYLLRPFTLIGVPMEIVEQIVIQTAAYKSLLENPIISDKEKDHFEALINRQNHMIDDLAISYRQGVKRIEKEACFIWYFSPYRLENIYSSRPIDLLEGPLNPNIMYKCVKCGYEHIAKDDIPEMFYSGLDMYCPNCATPGMKHAGE